MANQQDQWGGLLPADIDAIGGTFTVERLGKAGSLCITIFAEHHRLGAPVVVKVLRPELASAEDNVTRFLQVARQAAQIDSEHVVRILEYDRLGAAGPPYLAMERLPGGTFRDLLILHGPPPPDLAIEYGIQACRGLAAGHRKGLVHGDLRLSKIFRTLSEEQPPQVKLVDFAMSQALGHHTRSFGVGTAAGRAAAPESRAPEQLAGVRSIEPPTDAWAVGLVLWQLLTGKHPFATAASRQQYAQLVEAGPPSVREAQPNAPAELDRIIGHCLQRDPGDRPMDMATVAQALEVVAQQLPPRAERSTAPAPALRRRAASTRAGAPSPRDPDTTAEPVARRFLGAAMGSRRKTGGGSYSMVGRGGERSIIEEAPFSQRRRRRKRAQPAPRPSNPAAAPTAKRPGSTLPRSARATAPASAAAARRRPHRKADTAPATPLAREPKPAEAIASEAKPAGTAARSESPRPDGPPVRPHRGQAAQPVAPSHAQGPAIEAGTSPPTDRAADSSLELERAPARGDGGPEDRRPVGAAAARPGRRPDTPRPEPELSLELDLPPPEPVPPPDRVAPTAAGATEPTWDLELDTPAATPPSTDVPRPPVAADRTGRRSLTPARPTRAIPFGPYLLQRFLGAGSWSEAWLARSQTGSSPAAPLVVKRARRSSITSLETLEAIVRRHRMANHPGLIEVYDAGIADGTPYLVTEHVEGVDLRRLLDALPVIGRSIPYSVTARIIGRAAATLDALHRAGRDAEGAPWLHGDLRPSKVLVSLAGDVVIGTVGLALQRGGEGPAPGGPEKLDYQAPEELGGEPLDPTADLWSLGVVLGELLAGRPIFPGKGLDVLFAIQEASFTELRNVATMLPGGMFDVCERLLARFRSERFPSAAALAAALEPFEESTTRPAGELLVEWVARARKARPAREQPPEEPDGPERTAATSLSEQTAVAREALNEQGREPPIRVRRVQSGMMGQLNLHQLIEAIATGSVGPDDEVKWGTDHFERVRDVEPLARHLLVSAPGTQGTVLDQSAPDHVYHTRQTAMLEVLAQMRQCYATGMLLAQTQTDETARRREVFLQDGRLLSVRSSEPGDLLGEYLRSRGLIDGTEQARALAALPAFGGNMGNALIGLGFVDALSIYRALRQQARDRLAAVFAWPDARIDVYLSCTPPHVAFPLGLDLACVMMDGVLVASDRKPAGWLPHGQATIEPGPRLPPSTEGELDGLPPTLSRIGPVAGQRSSVDEAIRALQGAAQCDGPTAAATLVVARALQWIVVRQDAPDPIPDAASDG